MVILIWHYVVAIQRAVEEWKAKKAEGIDRASSDQEAEEEDIYAVEKDVSIS